MPAQPTLICIGGPTASGKTSMAIEVARHFNTEILSADSRQFYRGMAIGTAQPTREERAAVPHHFIDFLNPDTMLSAGDFERMALEKLDVLFRKHSVMVLVGGSGMYLKAVTEGMDNIPEVPLAVRNRLMDELRDHGLETLQRELREWDPAYFDLVDIQNPQRVVRALEVIRHTRLPFSHYHGQPKAPRPFRIIKRAPEWPREELYGRINRRVDAMLEAGWLDEVRKLQPYWKENALKTVGYKQLIAFLQHRATWADTVNAVKQDTRRYAKRQITWFKKEGFQWVQPHCWRGIIESVGGKG